MLAVLVLVAGGCGAGAGHRGPPGGGSPVTVPPPGSSAGTATGPGARTGAAPGTTTAAGPGPTTPCGTAPRPPARYAHVVWIWMENHTWADVLGPGSPAPYLRSLARACGTDTAWASVGSPSLPNYLGATSGGTLGVSDDADPTAHAFAADNLFRQVRAAGGTEVSYVESMPSPCSLTSAGSYAAKHNPAVYYDGPGDRAACRADDVAFHGSPGGPPALRTALAGGDLPAYTSITPDLCHDMHDCPVATGDAWLATWVPRILASPAYRAGTTALVIVWDEPTPLADIVVAPSIRPGTVSSRPVDHYSLLRATEEMLGLPLLGHAAAAVDLRGVLRF